MTDGIIGSYWLMEKRGDTYFVRAPAASRERYLRNT